MDLRIPWVILDEETGSVGPNFFREPYNWQIRSQNDRRRYFGKNFTRMGSVKPTHYTRAYNGQFHYQNNGKRKFGNKFSRWRSVDADSYNRPHSWYSKRNHRNTRSRYQVKEWTYPGTYYSTNKWRNSYQAARNYNPRYRRQRYHTPTQNLSKKKRKIQNKEIILEIIRVFKKKTFWSQALIQRKITSTRGRGRIQ
ncbi:hypothetical protein M0812_05058 [Anaeramoeba flamelloides]|uniref:Uncharacterized protein n=1 Tax=Anaeramoeba flamelloides TaxID=1746091 RepID=A0AAV8AAT5_9EUKA|nr:hypothetical protein M0812_05058 [Anaeramoeba flamelloides]